MKIAPIINILKLLLLLIIIGIKEIPAEEVNAVSNSLRVLLWSVFSLGMLFLAVMAFWVFLIVLGAIIIVRFLYAKLFHKPSGITIRTFTIRPGPENPHAPNREAQPGSGNQEYTTVINADNPDQEYKIPKIK